MEAAWSWASERWQRLVRWSVQGAWPGAILVVSGVIGATAMIRYGQTPNDDATGGDSVQGWGAVALLGSFGLLIVGVVILGEWSKRRRFRAGNRAIQIERLTTSLQSALTAIDTIKGDIEAGNRTLAELEQRSEVQRQLAHLSAEEAAAVRAALKAEFRDQSRSSLVRDVVLGAVFFLLGLVASQLLGR